jgi:hypothetical protein
VSEKSNIIGHKVRPDAVPDIIFRVNTRCPVRRPVRLFLRLLSVTQTIDSKQPPGIQILLIYSGTDVSYIRNYGVDEEDKALLLTKCINFAGDVTAVVL